MEPLRWATDLSPAPERVPLPGGDPGFGVYRGRIGEVDLAALAKGAGWSRLRRLFAEKRWRFLGVFSPHVIAGAAIVRAGYVGSAFAFALDRNEGTLTQLERLVPPWGLCDVPSDRGAGLARFRGWGLVVEIDCTRSGQTRLEIRSRALRAQIAVSEPAEPLALVSPVKPTGWNVTHKAAGLAAEGHLEIAGRSVALAGAHAVTDDTAGLLARETAWRWAAAANGRWGLNLVEGFNDHLHTENGVWRAGILHPVGAAHFLFDAADPTAPWRITTDDGAVDLTFRPEGMRKGDVKLKIVESIYRAPLGTYAGTLLGEAVENLPGIAEDHRARW